MLWRSTLSNRPRRTNSADNERRHGMSYRTFLATLPLVGLTLSAQAPAPPLITAFEVASVKINRSGLPGGFSQIHLGGRFTETNQTLRQIVIDAYEMEGFRVFGGPD